MLGGKPGSGETSVPQHQPSLTHPEPLAKPLPCPLAHLPVTPTRWEKSQKQHPGVLVGAERGCVVHGVLPPPKDPHAGSLGLCVAALCLAHWGCAGQGGAGVGGERVCMETCRPPAGDMLHKQEFCQSCKKCEGRSSQHVVWAEGT